MSGLRPFSSKTIVNQVSSKERKKLFLVMPSMYTNQELRYLNRVDCERATIKSPKPHPPVSKTDRLTLILTMPSRQLVSEIYISRRAASERALRVKETFNLLGWLISLID